MAKKIYYVNCGNWCVKFNIDPSDFKSTDELYIEIATRGLEVMFGTKEFEDDEDDYYAVLDENGKNVLTEKVITDIPIPTFTTTMYVISNKNNKPHKILQALKTSAIFANAAQHENYKLAINAEKQESKSKKKK